MRVRKRRYNRYCIAHVWERTPSILRHDWQIMCAIVSAAAAAVAKNVKFIYLIKAEGAIELRYSLWESEKLSGIVEPTYRNRTLVVRKA